MNGVSRLRRYDECMELGSAWSLLSEASRADLSCPDVTASHEWTMALWENLLGEGDAHVIVSYRDGRLSGVLPLYATWRQVHRVPCRVISAYSELYSGRWGFVVAERQDFEAMVEWLETHISRWEVFQVTLVEGSDSDAWLRQIQRERGYRLEVADTQVSPYIVLDATWETYFASRPKKFRWTVRDAVRRLDARGRVAYRQFGKPEEVNEFMSALVEIERSSWKEEAGTSITMKPQQESFYRSFAQAAAARGWFSGQLLTLDEEAVAYSYGVVYRGVFYDLKESYKSRYREFSPGHVLKASTLGALCRSGIRFYDFMGRCEDYKMRWTDQTYTRRTYLMYRGKLRGVAAWMSGQLLSRAKRRWNTGGGQPSRTVTSVAESGRLAARDVMTR